MTQNVSTQTVRSLGGFLRLLKGVGIIIYRWELENSHPENELLAEYPIFRGDGYLGRIVASRPVGSHSGVFQYSGNLPGKDSEFGTIEAVWLS